MDEKVHWITQSIYYDANKAVSTTKPGVIFEWTGYSLKARRVNDFAVFSYC